MMTTLVLLHRTVRSKVIKFTFLRSTPVRAIDSFVYMISSNVIGLDKTKTNLFGPEGLGLFLFFLLPHAWRPYSIILAKGNSVKLAINYTRLIIYLFSHHK